MIGLTPIAAMLLALPTFATTINVGNLSGGERVACAKLKLKYPGQTYYPGSVGYTYETQSGSKRLDVV